MYKIAQTDLLDITLAQCKTLEDAKKYLKNMEKTDKYLQKVYGWLELPEYKIIKIEEE